MSQAPALLEAMAAVHTQPLWSLYKTLNTREPQFYEPMLWPWVNLAPLVERACREVSMRDAERRALLLTHPSFPGTVFTTPSLSAALQILEPGESAPPHRHTLAALRLVMTGEGAVTYTDGKRCAMEPGDMILTPAMTWHEHRHEGKSRMVWFDGLDYPLARQLGTVFFEHGPVSIPERGMAALDDAGLLEGGVLPDGHPTVAPYSPLFRYPWRSVKRALEALPAAADGARSIRYVNPSTGGALMPTIDAYALRPGATPTRRMRTTATAIAVVIEGEGESRIGERHFQWRQHDVFTLPRWQWTEHRARSEPATLFLMTDRQFLLGIDHLREELEA